MKCPTSNVQFTGAYIGYSTSYGWNYLYFGNSASNKQRGWGTKINRIPQPSTTLVTGDSKDPDGVLATSSQQGLLYPAKSCLYLLPVRHSGQGNYWMADGHVQPLTPAKVVENDCFLAKQDKSSTAVP